MQPWLAIADKAINVSVWDFSLQQVCPGSSRSVGRLQRHLFAIGCHCMGGVWLMVDQGATTER
jgi:hypothetical protein